MDDYCRFCGRRQNNLSNIFELQKGVCDWLIEMVSQGLNQQSEFKNNLEVLPKNICYSCLCTIEDINFFINKCRLSIVRLEEIWRNNFQDENIEIETNLNCETEIDVVLKDEDYELEYLKMSDEETILETYDEYEYEEEVTDYNRCETIDNDITNFEILKNFQCTKCFKCFASINDLAIHDKSHRSFLCTKCGANFNERQSFSYHMKKHMNDVFTCDFCSKTFLTKYQLTSHRWIHTGAGFENHECKQCGKKCRTAHELEIHIRFHTQLRPYKCETCSKAFIVKTHLKQHMVTHTGERNFICNSPGCNKSYTTISSLKKHKDSHLPDSEKHIPCEYCTKKFSMHFILKDHIRKSHSKLVASQEIIE